MSTLILTPTSGVDARCTCGGFLLYTATGEPEHVDTCAELHPADAPCPDQHATHRTCSTPRPVACGHRHRRPSGSLLAATAQCREGLPCCGCCQE